MLPQVQRCLGPAFLAASLALLPVAAGRAEEAPRTQGSPREGAPILLHFRWQDGRVTLVDRIPLSGKPKSSRRAETRRDQTAREPDAPRTGFSYELLDAQGRTLLAAAMPDPGLLRHEFQEPGLPHLTGRFIRRDSADFFLTLTDPAAGSIRFHRNAPGSRAAAKNGVATAGLALLPVQAARAASSPVGELIVLQETGPRDRRVNLAIIGDGYTASERAKFLQDLKTASDAVIRDEPLSRYADYFNVYGIFVASAQSGADHPDRGIAHDTYFNARYSGRLLTVDEAKGIQVIRSRIPESDIFFALVNDTAYGGSGGQLAVANFANPEIVAHEIQHSFTSLADEYEYGDGPYYTESPNATTISSRTLVRWKHWIKPETPVPTPETQTWRDDIGVFEGAWSHASGWYRPKLTCRMRENEAQFCSVCNEAILLEMYDKVSPLDSAWPPVQTVAAEEGFPVELRIVPKSPSHPLRVTWILDGTPVPEVRGNLFDRILQAGNHHVVARVEDTTSLVRLDPLGILRDSVEWLVAVEPSTALDGKPRKSRPAPADGRYGVPVFRKPGTSGSDGPYSPSGRRLPAPPEE